MDRVLDWIGLKPAVSAVLIAVLQIGLLAACATIFGVALPATPANVITTWILLSLGNEAHRMFAQWSVGKDRDTWKGRHARDYAHLTSEIVNHGGTIHGGSTPDAPPKVTWVTGSLP